MLDPVSIEKLAESPEQNDPLLNVALAEEGGGRVLLALASSASLGVQAIDVIAERLAANDEVLHAVDEETSEAPALELEKKIIAHPNASAVVRDAMLARHVDDPFFVLSAGAHRDATTRALETLATWPNASPLHDRPWLASLVAVTSYTGLLAAWSEGGELLREAAGALSDDPALLSRLARDSSRRVRRAVAGNPKAGELRAWLAAGDVAAEVRARALSPPVARTDGFALPAQLRAMTAGGTLAGDVRRALLDAGALLDEEGAFLGARHLDKEELHSLVAQATGPDRDPLDARGAGVGVGLGLRCRASTIDECEGQEMQLSSDIVHLVTRQPSAETRLTGKARVALWIAQCLLRSRVVSPSELAHIAPGALAGDRMVLHRWTAGVSPRMEGLFASSSPLPAALVELSWRSPSVSDEAMVALARRVAPSAREGRELPEDELDLPPLARPLPVLERVVLAAIARVPVSPRAALAAIALEPRRCRYVLSAMPTWKGSLTGTRLARVLRSYAGALSAAARPTGSSPPSTGPRPASVARWTDRKLTEIEAAIAIAIGDLTVDELLRRMLAGSIRLQDGLAMAAAIEARAALDGPATFAPVLDHAGANRSKDAAALALWMLLENLDRTRASSLIGSAIDGLAVAGSVVAPAVCEALATLERRSPGRLETVHAQSPRGRATVASAIARAYRAFGGMRDET